MEPTYVHTVDLFNCSRFQQFPSSRDYATLELECNEPKFKQAAITASKYDSICAVSVKRPSDQLIMNMWQSFLYTDATLETGHLELFDINTSST